MVGEPDRGAASGVRPACRVDHREQVRCADRGRAEGRLTGLRVLSLIADRVTTASLVERAALTVAGGVTMRSTSMIVPTVTVRELSTLASLSVRISRPSPPEVARGVDGGSLAVPGDDSGNAGDSSEAAAPCCDENPPLDEASAAPADRVRGDAPAQPARRMTAPDIAAIVAAANPCLVMLVLTPRRVARFRRGT
jgi:hypothetical protein